MKRGQSLIEIIVAFGMTALFIPALITGLVASRQARPQTESRQQATLLARQALEAVRTVREKSWPDFAVDGIFHSQVSGTTWSLVSGPSPAVDGFITSVEISAVHRDAVSGQIVAVDGVNDPSTKLVTVTVSWTYPLTGSVSFPQYFTRYMDNMDYFETTKAQFDSALAVRNSVATTDVSGGEVVLSGGGHGDWCQPTLTQWGFNLNHNASGTSIAAIPGHAFVVTGNNNASETFYDVIISSTYPPTAVSGGVLAGQNKAYGVVGGQTYAYIATDTKQKQGMIINLATHQDIGWMDLQSNSVNGRGIVTDSSGNYAYLTTTDNKIHVFNISTKTGTHTSIANTTLTGVAAKIVLVGDHLYAALDATSNQLAIIPITGGGSGLGSPEYVTVPGQAGKDIFINITATRAYLATAASASQAELFVIDLSTKQILASQDTNGMNPTGVAAVTNNKVIIVGQEGYEYQVYNFNSSTNTFSSCTGGAGLLNIDAGIRGIATVNGTSGAFSYLLTADGASEFKIIEGGPSGMTAASGTFTSAPFPGSTPSLFPIAFNRLQWHNVQPPGITTVKLWVSGAEPVSGSCDHPNYTFVGPDGTPGTYFTGDGAIPLFQDGIGYSNPAPCFKYKVELTSTDPGVSPEFDDITVSYSP